MTDRLNIDVATFNYSMWYEWDDWYVHLNVDDRRNEWSTSTIRPSDMLFEEKIHVRTGILCRNEYANSLNSRSLHMSCYVSSESLYLRILCMTHDYWIFQQEALTFISLNSMDG